jgi:catechol 2,3-dioxygenase-like lactoylglutathione lyase family enzyme
MTSRLLIALTVLAATPAFSQLAEPNAAGVAAGHIHLNVSDISAQEHFWTEVGGKVVMRQKLVTVEFPGIYILLRKAPSTGGSVGSVINHFGFYVKDFDAAAAKWKADGLKWEPGQNHGQGFLTGPDEVRVEIYENKSISTPVAMHHIHLFVPDPSAAQKWYVEHFGATAGKRGRFDTANVPGTEITLAKADTPVAPSKGRSVDHIGFEVTNIDAFVKKLEGEGIKIEGPIRTSPNLSTLRVAFLTDPWGTRIELSEGLRMHTETSSR